MRRQLERRREKFFSAFWRWNEKRRFGLTLKMTRVAGQWRYD